MTLPISLVLIALGAILVWGVTSEAEGINVDAVGVILMVIGLIGFLLSLLVWDRWGWGPWGRRGAYVEGGPVYRRRRVVGTPVQRSTVVEEEVDEVPPAGPPPP